MALRKSIFFALMLILAGAVSAQSGQLSKDETKRWKKVATEYRRNPAALKNLTEDYNRFKQQAEELQTRLATLESSTNQDRNRVTFLEQENAQLRNQLTAAQETIDQMNLERTQAVNNRPTNQPAVSDTDYSTGVVYRIQVGAFRKNQIPENFRNQPDMTVEEEGGLQKVLLGNYRSYEDAQARLNDIKRGGVKSPWIVAYRDGRRVSLKEARGF